MKSKNTDQLVLYTSIYLSIYLFIYLSIYRSTALCRTLAAFSVSQSYKQLVVVLGRGISPWQVRYLHTERHRHRINAQRYPCFEWDSNERSQPPSERIQFNRAAIVHDSNLWYEYIPKNTNFMNIVICIPLVHTEQ
jgi:hypothetical protein